MSFVIHGSDGECKLKSMALAPIKLRIKCKKSIAYHYSFSKRSTFKKHGMITDYV